MANYRKVSFAEMPREKMRNIYKGCKDSKRSNQGGKVHIHIHTHTQKKERGHFGDYGYRKGNIYLLSGVCLSNRKIKNGVCLQNGYGVKGVALRAIISSEVILNMMTKQSADKI